MAPNLRQRSPRLKTREKAPGSSSRRSSSGVPGINRDAVALAQEPGLAPTFETARMHIGAIKPLRLVRVFGVTSFAFRWRTRPSSRQQEQLP
jgi:hypothetical protein